MLKKGQIFLIAALIISGITIGFGTIYNEASVERQDAAVYDLSTELRSELQQVYDNGVINSKDEDKIQEDITKLALYYSEQNPDSNFEIFFGNETDIYYLSLDQINPKNADVEKLHVSSSEEGDADSPNLFRQNPSATVQPGQVTLCLTPEQRGIEGEETDTQPERTKSLDSDNDIVCRPFTLQQGQNFYLVVRKKVRNEQVVIYR
ncbi:hypothetical protein J4461_01805 [Candidatus Pacearchaeota archaeon]|nr:hypothetical protein [Candidatus Pacearchaeota archaeon]